MDQRAVTYLVDGDSRRRAAIVHELSGIGFHVEPFEDAHELVSSGPNPGVILVRDEDDSVATLRNQLAKFGTWFPIIAFSEQPSARRVVQAMVAGATDYIDWPVTSAKLADRLRDADGTVTEIVAARLREGAARSRVDCLTKREREVLIGVTSGKSSRDIGEKLRISPRTVEIHRSNMLKRMGATNTSDAIRIALQARLMD